MVSNPVEARFRPMVCWSWLPSLPRRGGCFPITHCAACRRCCSSALGLFGIYVQIGWILELFGKDIGDYPWCRYQW